MHKTTHGWLSRAVLLIAALVSLGLFAWPLLISDSAATSAPSVQGIFLAVAVALLAVIFVELGSGRINATQLSMLALLVAANSVVRLMGAGISGVETVFFLIIIGASVFGPGFGYLLGSGSLLVSALVGAGIGPWLPFQMLAAGMVGLGAGLLPRAWGKVAQTVILAAYAVPAAYLYGALMTMWNWPFLAGSDSTISYRAGAPLAENLTRFVHYEMLTGGLVWDTGRAITTCVLLAVTAPALTATLSRAAARAGAKRF